MAEEPPRFAADRMLARLARWLRLMGADVLHDDSLGGAELVRLARVENRPILTRDKRLRTAPDALFIESHLFRDQIREVMERFPFDPHRFAFTRCSRCNELLRRVPREVVARRVPPFVYASHEGFALCERCGRIYWDATHMQRASREIDALSR
ncbi:MAG TPA: Mut7-C RNAse domain-containing protein [Candidatus Binataceae bacterium]|nr:Mut7-C RNAse domain-containing protein [Candidatus Binataceae bacterium]